MGDCRVAIGATALIVLPASAPAATFKFGSKLNPTVQPSNSLPAHDCRHQNPGQPCTFVQNEAYGRPDGGERSPVNGVLKRVRVIAGGKGHFRLQLTRARKVNGNWKAKAVHTGPVIRFDGQKPSNFNNDHYKVESFPVASRSTGESASACGRRRPARSAAPRAATTP